MLVIISPQASHGTVRERLDSYGSSRKRFQLISGAYTTAGKQTRLHFVQCVELSAALAQVFQIPSMSLSVPAALSRMQLTLLTISNKWQRC
jgi:hypothetical protein